VKTRTIKTIVGRLIESISEHDIATVAKFGDNYVMGEINSLAGNVAGDPRAIIARIAMIAIISHSLKELAP
jgi:hypothetical protein